MTVEEHLASTQSIANLIDQTLLKPEATGEDIVRLCREAAEHRFCSVCVNPHWVRLARTTLGGSSVRVCTVIGFPLGANRTEVKTAEARLAVAKALRRSTWCRTSARYARADFATVQSEIAELAEIAHASKAIA